jgi:hypothetical protein
VAGLMIVRRTMAAASPQMRACSRSSAMRMFGVAGLIDSRAALARSSNSAASSSSEPISVRSLMAPPFAALPVDVAMLAPVAPGTIRLGRAAPRKCIKSSVPRGR